MSTLYVVLDDLEYNDSPVGVYDNRETAYRVATCGQRLHVSEVELNAFPDWWRDGKALYQFCLNRDGSVRGAVYGFHPYRDANGCQVWVRDPHAGIETAELSADMLANSGEEAIAEARAELSKRLADGSFDKMAQEDLAEYLAKEAKHRAEFEAIAKMRPIERLMRFSSGGTGLEA